MKLGIFGGSFDPIHKGHLVPVREARAQLGLERVVFVPTAVPPHKPGRQFAPAWARFAMVELAVLREEGFEASPIELEPDRPSYTVDTLRHFRRARPDGELYLILGADGFCELTSWRDWRQIVRLAELAVLTRPDWSLTEVRDRLPRELAELALGDRVHFVQNRPVDVSATDIRRQLAAGADPSPGAVPDLVLEYIRKYSLYQ